MRNEESSAEELKKADVKYVWHHWLQMKRYAKKPMVFDRADGALMWDLDGKEYIDAAAGVAVVNAGHGNKQIINAVKEQLDKVSFVVLLNQVSVPTVKLAQKLAEIAPGDLETSFFVNSGSEAVEASIMMARQYHFQSGAKGKYKVISRWMSYHGCTLAALSTVGMPSRRRPFAPLLVNFPHVAHPYCYRCFFGKEYPDCDLECARAVETTIKIEGEDNVAAFIAEPIPVAAGGGIVPPDEYFPMIRDICDSHEVLMIFDEVMTGFGRTGKIFCCQNWNVTPDIMAVAKAITGGYATLSAAITKPKIAEVFLGEEGKKFLHGHTYGGVPIACAAALAYLDVMEREKLPERAADLGEYFLKELTDLEQDHKIVGDVRGKGLLLGVEFVKNKETKEPFDENQMIGSHVEDRMLDRRIIIRSSRVSPFTSDFLWITPPLIITKNQIDRVVAGLDETITEVEKTL